MGSDKRVTFENLSILRQPEVANLVQEIRQVAQLTQGQLADELGVAYETISRWENGHIRPSTLALKQIYFFLQELTLSSSEAVRDKSQSLLVQYFSKQGEKL